jgi:hypothetical protein
VEDRRILCDDVGHLEMTLEAPMFRRALLGFGRRGRSTLTSSSIRFPVETKEPPRIRLEMYEIVSTKRRPLFSSNEEAAQ